MKSDPIPRSLTPPQSNFDIHSTRTASASSSIVPYRTNVDKCPNIYAIFARMTNISSSPKKSMPISINNSLSSINLHIGNPDGDENRIRMHFNTGAVMNTGN